MPALALSRLAYTLASDVSAWHSHKVPPINRYLHLPLGFLHRSFWNPKLTYPSFTHPGVRLAVRESEYFHGDLRIGDGSVGDLEDLPGLTHGFQCGRTPLPQYAYFEFLRAI